MRPCSLVRWSASRRDASRSGQPSGTSTLAPETASASVSAPRDSAAAAAAARVASSSGVSSPLLLLMSLPAALPPALLLALAFNDDDDDAVFAFVRVLSAAGVSSDCGGVDVVGPSLLGRSDRRSFLPSPSPHPIPHAEVLPSEPAAAVGAGGDSRLGDAREESESFLADFVAFLLTRALSFFGAWFSRARAGTAPINKKNY